MLSTNELYNKTICCLKCVLFWSSLHVFHVGDPYKAEVEFGGLMVSALNSGLSGPGLSHGWGQ